MSWLEGLTEALGGGAGEEGPAAAYQRAAIMQAGAAAGLSGNAVLQALRSIGLGFRTQQFYDIWRDIQQRYSASRAIQGIPPEAIIDQSLMPPAPSDWTGQYIYQVRMVYRERTELGYELREKWLNIASGRLLAPAEAAQGVLDILNVPPTRVGTPTIETSQVLTTQVTRMWHQRPPRQY